MRRARHRAAWVWALLALPLGLAACHSVPPTPQGPNTSAATEVKPALDPSFDWHGLLLAPFGSALQEVPLTLHEVLLFRDESRAAAAADDAECYASDAAAPRFAASTPQEYLLCFRHDRLSRIEATVRLAKLDAAQIFADACASWLKNAEPEAPPETPQSAAACDGHDAVARFSAHLDEDPDQPDSALSIKLDAVDRP